jgi:hypothetical protein
MKRKRTAVLDYADYTVELTDWNWSYSFGLNHRKGDPDPCIEFRHVELIGNLLGPKSVKCTRAVVHLLPNVNYDEPTRLGQEAHRAVGSVDSRGDTLHGGISVPRDALDAILTVLAAQRFKLLIMHGTRLRYAKALIHGYRLETNFDPEDLLLD